MKLQQVHSEMLPAIEQHQHRTGQKSQDSNRNARKPVRYFKCHKLGHIARNCPLNSVNAVVGKANEVSLFVNDKQVLAFLDTGSMASTMASSLCSLLNLSIQP